MTKTEMYYFIAFLKEETRAVIAEDELNYLRKQIAAVKTKRQQRYDWIEKERKLGFPGNKKPPRI